MCCISSTEQDDNVVRVARKQWEKLMRSNLAELGVKKILKQLGENFEVFEFPKNAVAD